MHHSRRLIAVLLAACALQVTLLHAAWRKPVKAKNGIVVSAESLATRAGIDVLQRGFPPTVKFAKHIKVCVVQFLLTGSPFHLMYPSRYVIDARLSCHTAQHCNNVWVTPTQQFCQ